MAKPKVELHLAKLPMDDPEALYEMILKMGRQMSGREPTARDKAEARKTLGLPAKPPARKRPKPKAKPVKTRKR